MKTFFLSICGRLRRICGGLAVRLGPVFSLYFWLASWLVAEGLRRIGAIFKTLGKEGYRRKKFLELLESLAKAVAGGATLAFFFDKPGLGSVGSVILGALVVWLVATHEDEDE